MKPGDIVRVTPFEYDGDGKLLYRPDWPFYLGEAEMCFPSGTLGLVVGFSKKDPRGKRTAGIVTLTIDGHTGWAYGEECEVVCAAG